MVTLPSSVRIYLAATPTDMRKGHDGLVSLLLVERDQGRALPRSYRDFLARMARGAGTFLRGTAIFIPLYWACARTRQFCWRKPPRTSLFQKMPWCS